MLTAFAVVALGLGAPVDLSRHDARSGIRLRHGGEILEAEWPVGRSRASVRFDLGPARPLLASLAIAGRTIARGVQPNWVVTTGSRVERPGERYIFFDKPASRPTETHTAVLALTGVRAVSAGQRTTLAFSGLSAGPFTGELLVHLYAGSPLVHLEASMGQGRRAVAYVYDAVLDGAFAGFAWKGTDDRMAREAPAGQPRPIAVRQRTVMAETEGGTLAVFPPPHAFFFPRDHTTNFRFAQVGTSAGRARFGLRQDPAGGPGHEGTFIPWFDAPPGRPQRMGMFVLLSPARAEGALSDVARYTHGDTFLPMTGRTVFTSHYHFPLAVPEMEGKPRAPEVVSVFKKLKVDVVHLAEFHGDGHPQDPGPRRLPELRAMFDVCRKYSDRALLLLPGEEANVHLGSAEPKVPKPGHWVYLFPRPVYLTLVRGAEQPLVETIAPYGRVYHAGDEADMVQILRREKGLAWTAHPRIKSSHAAPDGYRERDWFKDDLWLGAAWKAMPGDLSQRRLGVRVLDLLDDMNTWGRRKVSHGEVDTFRLDRTHELYGHMNVNYLRMERKPTVDDWSPVLEALRQGDFFVTTGEVLVHGFQASRDQVTAELAWTFPLDHARIAWWDGTEVRHREIPLAATAEHGRQRFRWPIDLSQARWVRLEVWDVASNGAFTQPSTLY